MFSLYFQLQGCWPSGFLINVMRIIKSSGQHWSGYGLGHSCPGRLQLKRKQRVCFYLQRISGSSRNGPGRELHGTIRESLYSKTATGQNVLKYRSEPYLRGPADDVTLCHYGVSDICWRFADVVYVTAPSNCRLHPQTMVPVPCIKTTSRVSITKAVGP